jgi:serine protease Do
LETVYEPQGEKVLTRAILISLIITAVAASGCVTTGLGAQSAVIHAKDKVAPALVHIRPVKEVFTQGRREEVQVVGSGFIISPDGYVATNEHVAGESSLVRCVLSTKEEVEARVVGTDPFTDLAVLKLDTDRKDFPYVKLGSFANVEAGQTVLALGSPHGLSRSVSLGIISVTDRYLGDQAEVVAPFNNWIQTDAAINPGNSGGPLVNLRGEVIGVNARKLTGADNVGFAIPVDIAREVIDEIIEFGHVRRSWLGLTLQEMTGKTDDPSQEGAVIAFIDPLSPAAGVGMAPGDVLVAINGKPISARYVEELPLVRKRIADLPIGEPATVTIRRGDEDLSFEMDTVERSQRRGQEIEFAGWGFTGSALTPELARSAQLPSTAGVVVTGTQVGGYAANAGLNRWDLIISVDGQDISGIDDFQTLYDQILASGKERVLLDVRNIQRNALITRYVLLKQFNDAEAELPDPTAVGEPNSAE